MRFFLYLVPLSTRHLVGNCIELGLRGGEDTKTTSSLSAELSEPRFDSDSEEVGAGEAVAGGAPVDAFSGSDTAAVSSSVEDSASLLIFSAI